MSKKIELQNKWVTYALPSDIELVHIRYHKNGIYAVVKEDAITSLHSSFMSKDEIKEKYGIDV